MTLVKDQSILEEPTILFYIMQNQTNAFGTTIVPLSESYINETYRNIDEKTGEKFTTTPLTGPGGVEKGNPVFEWNGHTRAWRYNKETFQRLHNEGKLYYSKTGYPRQKLYLSDSKGVPVQSLWIDINSLSGAHAERLGYPTQKPIALLERIIKASSNEGDLVLDPFCGCGTTIHAAEKLNRKWIGIDITHLAIGLIRRRLIEAFPQTDFDVQGVPKDVGGARELAAQDKHQFQLWALSMIEAQPFKGGRKGADGGVDGYLYFKPDGKTTEKVVVSVKGGEHVDVKMIRDLIATVDRERAKLGVFLTLADPTKPMKTEAAAAGLYESPLHGMFFKIQILTIEDVFSGHRPEMPFRDPSVFRQAKREESDKTQLGLDV